MNEKKSTIKKLTLADLKHVVGGLPKIKIEVEPVPGGGGSGGKAKGEG